MMTKQRGFSIAEVLTVTVILGMLLSAMAFMVPVLVRSPLQVQSQVDQVDTAAIALYKIRRDLAQGDTNGVLGCSLTPTVSCTTVGTSPTIVQALVVATADDGLGHFQIDAVGYPKWQGVYVYWLVPNAAGTAYDLMRAYEPTFINASNGVPNGFNGALVNPLVVAALLISPPPVLTNYITSMKLGSASGSSTISFQLVAGTTGGVNQTQTNFLSDTYARN